MLNPFHVSFVILVCLLFTNCNTLQQESYRKENNFLLGIAQLGATEVPYNVSQCGSDLVTLLAANDKKQPWSTKVIDGFGGTPRSFLWGNYFWFSSQELCEDVNVPFSITLLDSFSLAYYNHTSPFAMQFTMIYLRFKSPYYIDWKLPYENLIHLGLCLPKSCNQSVLEDLTANYFRQNIFEPQRTFSMQLEVVDAKVPRSIDWNFFTQTGSLLFIVILLVCLMLMVLAEFSNKSQQPLKTVKQQTQHVQQQQQPSGIFKELLECFDVRKNIQTAIQLESSRGERSFLSVIAGLRTLICLWVTVFHVYYYSLFAVSNQSIVFSKLEYFVYQPVLQACFYVDVFFIMSSFLLVYNFLTNASQIERIKDDNWWLNMKFFARTVGQRYMRLTPVLVVTMLLADMVATYINQATPFHLDSNSGIYCKSNWWQNLIYAHNLLDMNTICCSWTWYLGCEMQFFVLLTILLMVYAKNAPVAKVMFTALTLGFALISWICNYYWGISFHIDKVNGTLNELYVKPWVRINPYMGGAVMAYLLHSYQQRTLQRVQNQPFKMAKDDKGSLTTKLFWIMCAMLYLITNFMGYWRSAPTWLVSTIMSFGKLFFALCVGGIIALCACGRAGHFNSLLSARPFLLLNKFCYSIYMVAPLIVFVVFGLRRQPTPFSEMGSGMDFIAIVVISCGCAFLMFVLVELPVNRATKILLRQTPVNINSKLQQQQSQTRRPMIKPNNIKIQSFA